MEDHDTIRKKFSKLGKNKRCLEYQKVIQALILGKVYTKLIQRKYLEGGTCSRTSNLL
jgi:hypothetical protein